MIAHITGTVFDHTKHTIIVDNNGIGYEIFVSNRIHLSAIKGEEITLFTHHRTKEDQNDLYGFAHNSEKILFEKLIAVSGIGPKTALLMLEFSPQEITQAIEREDIAFLSQAKGMGKKTVSRLILELKGKLPEISEDGKNTSVQGSVSQQVINCQDTLIGLGFDQKSIQKIFEETNPQYLQKFSDEELMKWALKELSSFSVSY